jgi:hypothetical protein
MTKGEITGLIPAVGHGDGLARAETFFREELQLATRNRGMPLEALRYPITPTGLHYLLVHYDIPNVDGAAWRLRVAGSVSRPLSVSLEELERRPARTLAVTMECAGNGRALFAPRRVSQPWLHEAIGTAEWTGTPRCVACSRRWGSPASLWRLSSPGATGGSKGERSSTTSGACRSRRRWARRCFLPGR